MGRGVKRVAESWAVGVHAFNPSTWETEAGGFLSSRTARAIQRKKGSKGRESERVEK
jgi:hypothetical protein